MNFIYINNMITQILLKTEQESEEIVLKNQWKDCILVLKQYKIDNRVKEIKELLKDSRIEESKGNELLAELTGLITGR